MYQFNAAGHLFSSKLGSKAQQPTPRMAQASARSGDLLFVSGGISDLAKFGVPDVWIFESSKMLWRQVHWTAGDTLPRGRHAHTLTMVNSSLAYMLGGIVNTGFTNELWRLTQPSPTSRTCQWSLVDGGRCPSPGPSDRAFHAAASLTNATTGAVDRMMLFGGLHIQSSGQPAALNDTWLFNVRTECWTAITASPHPAARMGHAMASLGRNNSIALFGGLDPVDWTLFNDLWLFNGTTNRWDLLQV